MEREITNFIDRFLEKEVEPVKEEIEELSSYPREILRKFGKDRVLAISFPEEYGGMGMKYRYLVYLAKRVGYLSGAIAEVIFSHLCMGAYPVYRFGTENQKKRFLIPSLSGEIVGGMAIAEPDVGSDIKSIRMKVEKGKGGFRLTGNKVFISNANHFDFMIFAARCGGTISLFLLERKGNEAKIKTKSLPMMGLRGADIGEIFLDDAFCPDENLIGTEGKGIELIMVSLNMARLFGAATCLGIIEAAYDYGLRYAKEREQFGRRLVEFQALRFMLVEMAIKLNISRLLLEKATEAFEREEDSLRDISLAKLYISEAGREHTDNMMHLLGAYGYCKEYPVERFLRDAHCFTIGEGTSEIQREILAKEYGIRE
jgi:alkylation response protein AidB-like acyl-CoA dehydrogenase